MRQVLLSMQAYENYEVIKRLAEGHITEHWDTNFTHCCELLEQHDGIKETTMKSCENSRQCPCAFDSLNLYKCCDSQGFFFLCTR